MSTDSHVALTGSDGKPMGVRMARGNLTPRKENRSYKTMGMELSNPMSSIMTRWGA